MTVRKLFLVASLWVISVCATNGWIHAQAPLPPRELRLPSQNAPAPTIISGNDLGFRVDGSKGAIPTGRFVVRINGQWTEVEESVVAKLLTVR